MPETGSKMRLYQIIVMAALLWSYKVDGLRVLATFCRLHPDDPSCPSQEEVKRIQFDTFIILKMNLYVISFTIFYD